MPMITEDMAGLEVDRGCFIVYAIVPLPTQLNPPLRSSNIAAMGGLGAVEHHRRKNSKKIFEMHLSAARACRQSGNIRRETDEEGESRRAGRTEMIRVSLAGL